MASGSLVTPAIYSFPPFFTRQRNLETEGQRKEDWVTWIIQWAIHNKQTELIVERELKGQLFSNEAIHRSLSLDEAVEILDFMEARGNGEWKAPGKTKFLILYKSLAEWSALLYTFVDRSGQMGSVFTVYELLEGDDTINEEFYGMDRALFMRVLEYMEREGRAKLFTASDPGKVGVKIL